MSDLPQPHLQALLPETVQLCLVSVILILHVPLRLLGLGTQGLHLQHQHLPLSAQRPQLPLETFCLAGGKLMEA